MSLLFSASFRRYKLSDDKNMGLKEKKFEDMRLAPDKEIKSETSATSPTGKLFEMKETDLEDLGVLKSDDCTFTAHIANVIDKAKNITSWILSEHFEHVNQNQ